VRVWGGVCRVQIPGEGKLGKTASMADEDDLNFDLSLKKKKKKKVKALVALDGEDDGQGADAGELQTRAEGKLE
jgi:hypothetical protein